jgi:hypothetical protein
MKGNSEWNPWPGLSKLDQVKLCNVRKVKLVQERSFRYIPKNIKLPINFYTNFNLMYEIRKVFLSARLSVCFLVTLSLNLNF